MQQKNVNIWEEALKQKATQPIAQSQERILILLGPQNSGKSTLVKLLRNEGESQPKPTYLLEYSYIRKGFAKKELVHCYDMSAKTQMDILPSLFTKETFPSVTVALCLDLSKPASIIPQVQHWVSTLKHQVNLALQQKIGLQEKYTEWQLKRRGENGNHEDFKSIILPPLNLLIVGCKYDLFEKYQTENRKWLSKALRYLAHTNNASLAFSSSKNPQLTTQLRGFFLETMFEDKPKITAQKDHLKPIFIYRNQDSLSSISVPASGSVSGLQILKRQLSGLFEQDEQKKREGVDPSKYIQPKIQVLISQRKKQMLKINRKKIAF